MDEFGGALATALRLIATLDQSLMSIVVRSLLISLSAVALATLIGLPLGAIVAVYHFPGRALVGALLNALMGLPPVVVGLVLYLLLSRSGPLGGLGLLYTPTAMVLAQWVLITPIVAALTRQAVTDLHEEYVEHFQSLGVKPWRAIWTLLWDGRFRLLTAVLAGFGRASAEVGAVLIVGGNINHVTRVMTTTIALETSKGDLPLALGLGIILLLLTFLVNVAAVAIQDVTQRLYG